MAPPLEENIALVLHKIDDLRLVWSIRKRKISIFIFSFFKEPVPVNEPKDGGNLNMNEKMRFIEHLPIF